MLRAHALSTMHFPIAEDSGPGAEVCKPWPTSHMQFPAVCVQPTS